MSWVDRLKRWSLRIVLGLVGFVLLSWLGLRLASDPVPTGERGPRADALARRIERAVDIDAWNRTAAVRWNFNDRHQHLWDKTRNLHRVVWRDREAIIDLNTKRGCARVAGREVRGEERGHLLRDAYAMWVNDSFWLNPLGKLFDPGVVRQLVSQAGTDALLITFTQNGLTPGDSYLWLLDSKGRPKEWRMWTRVPVGGLAASWEDWQALATGAQISTRHRILGFELVIRDVVGASSLKELTGAAPDPFGWCNVTE